MGSKGPYSPLGSDRTEFPYGDHSQLAHVHAGHNLDHLILRLTLNPTLQLLRTVPDRPGRVFQVGSSFDYRNELSSAASWDGVIFLR